ncbi:Protein Wnt-8b [Portunus trituberculatus]|uniref:Protein Wnt n=1 Tax=Portunus trituberculatus TaxID=210409 RepID=A0A5B7G9H4_PORTR|nr:Protein Wnt-8b [Portunus trituberculatus]
MQADGPMKQSVVGGMQLALKGCQAQMKWQRWACPEGHFNKMHGSRAATRESSLVHAITSAGVTYAVTKNCSQGHIKGCSCSEGGSRSHQDWKWRGCSDDVHFGSQVAERFLDSLEVAQDAPALVNRHNNRLGRMTVAQALRQSCKCHGVSGSCTTKTCWRQMQAFTAVAEAVGRKYRRAVKIKDINGLLEHSSRDARREAIKNRVFPARPRRLAYLNDSPDYCQVNTTIGWSGTVGRRCSRKKGAGVTRPERRSCKTLCRACNLVVDKNVSRVAVPCHCRFQWCCKVKCSTCLKRKVILSCSSK